MPAPIEVSEKFTMNHDFLIILDGMNFKCIPKTKFWVIDKKLKEVKNQKVNSTFRFHGKWSLIDACQDNRW